MTDIRSPEMNRDERSILEGFLLKQGIVPSDWESVGDRLITSDMEITLQDGSIVAVAISQPSPLNGCEDLFRLPNLKNLHLEFKGGKFLGNPVEIKSKNIEEITVGHGVELDRTDFLLNFRKLRQLIFHGTSSININGLERLQVAELRNTHLSLNHNSPKQLRLLKLFGGSLEVEPGQTFEDMSVLLLSRVDRFIVDDISEAFPNLELFIWKNQETPLSLPKGFDRLTKLKSLTLVGAEAPEEIRKLQVPHLMVA